MNFRHPRCLSRSGLVRFALHDLSSHFVMHTKAGGSRHATLKWPNFRPFYEDYPDRSFEIEAIHHEV